MFLIYPVLFAVILGRLLGGRPADLGRIPLRWGGAIAGGMIVQIALFLEPVTVRIGDLGPPIYLASSFVVLAAVVRNWRIPGLPILAAGAAANLAAIVANGGYMPASAEAMAALGRAEIEVYSNSAMMHEPLLAPLTDIFAMPAWVPGANIFSVGDVLIGVGVGIAIVVGMRGDRPWRRLGRWSGRSSAPDPSAIAAGGSVGVQATIHGRPIIATALPPIERAAVHEQLAGAGFEPVAVADATELEGLLARHANVAVAILDGLGDLETCLEMYAVLHARERQTPALTVVSARTLERSSSAPSSRAGDEYLARPISPEAVRRQVEAMDLRRRIGHLPASRTTAHDRALAV